ncbi:MAG: phosphocholine cytidylyltransferase family protein [Akkermansiaceae bacterium]|nr:phosphocholine cytidylyltransferase family protein [Akkermansiaceae bacterium]
MQAIILAAGRGSRLGDHFGGLPKCLLEIGRRRLVEHQLEVLSEAGVGPVGMVVGYCADEIREVVGIQAEYIPNPRWETTNSLYSFLQAREWVKGPVLILNSDVLFHPEVVTRVLQAEGDCIAYDSGSGNGQEHMKVRIVNGRLEEMCKKLREDKISGENVGVLRFEADTVQHLFDIAQSMIGNGGEKDWLGGAVQKLANEKPIEAVDVAGLPWGEIDFPYDLARVRREVWPEIRRETSRPIRFRKVLQVAAIVTITAALAFIALKPRTKAVESTWDVVDVENLERVAIRSGNQVRKWPRLDPGASATVVVNGSTGLRVDSRLIASPGMTEPAPYVIEILLDGERVDWFKADGVPSGTWTHEEWTVCKRERINFEIPGGEHLVRVRLVASDGGPCLLRITMKEPAFVAD